VVLKGPGACNKNLLFYFLFWCGTQRSRCLQQEPAFLFFILMWYSKVPVPATRTCFFIFYFDVVLKGPGACIKNLLFYFLFWCGTQRSRCLQQEPAFLFFILMWYSKVPVLASRTCFLSPPHFRRHQWSSCGLLFFYKSIVISFVKYLS
jgi:hypothetical protein